MEGSLCSVLLHVRLLVVLRVPELGHNLPGMSAGVVVVRVDTGLLL